MHGKNKGLIEETISKDLKPRLSKNIQNYEESEILSNLENFKENILNKSFFENDKLIIIQRTSDKILKLIEDINKINLNDTTIILVSDALEKKSKLRNYFEKNNQLICVPFYEDNNQSLTFIVQNFLKKNNLNLSQQNINIIIERAKGDRINLNNELSKIESFCKNKSKINTADILRLTNLAENYDASELVENSLTQNKNKTLKILNENNFSNEDCILILRIYLSKLKRLLNISSLLDQEKDIEKIIANYKPPIFWKEKDIIKKQLNIWQNEKIRILITTVNQLELKIKKNPSISIFLLTDFILEKTFKANN